MQADASVPSVGTWQKMEAGAGLTTGAVHLWAKPEALWAGSKLVKTVTQRRVTAFINVSNKAPATRGSRRGGGVSLWG